MNGDIRADLLRDNVFVKKHSKLFDKYALSMIYS